jgi:hypothetical protein
MLMSGTTPEGRLVPLSSLVHLAVSLCELGVHAVCPWNAQRDHAHSGSRVLGLAQQSLIDKAGTQAVKAAVSGDRFDRAPVGVEPEKLLLGRDVAWRRR